MQTKSSRFASQPARRRLPPRQLHPLGASVDKERTASGLSNAQQNLHALDLDREVVFHIQKLDFPAVYT